MNLLLSIRHHLAARPMSPSRFGREAIGDPRLVSDLAKGREPRPETVSRVCDFMRRRETRP